MAFMWLFALEMAELQNRAGRTLTTPPHIRVGDAGLPFDCHCPVLPRGGQFFIHLGALEEEKNRLRISKRGSPGQQLVERRTGPGGDDGGFPWGERLEALGM